MLPIIDENPEYWQEYTRLQQVKHALLRRYLGGWFPKLSWTGRVLYIDTHAGQGAYASGQLGSPLIALDVLLNHKARAKILEQSEVVFLFVEASKENKRLLEERIEKLGRLPSKIRCHVVCEDYAKVIGELINKLRVTHSMMAPAFVFVDPYSFRLPMQLLAQLKSFPKCELFINFMWRYVDMAINNPLHEQSMDVLFGKSDWRAIRNIADSDQRCERAISLFRDGLGAKYITRMKMIGATRYVLIHATNHSKGHELMKEAMWAMCPAGDFEVRVGDHSDQQYLLKLGYELEPLRKTILMKFQGKTVPLQELYSFLDETPYLKKHLHDVLRGLLRVGEVSCQEPLVFARYPTITFSSPDVKRPEGN